MPLERRARAGSTRPVAAFRPVGIAPSRRRSRRRRLRRLGSEPGPARPCHRVPGSQVRSCPAVQATRPGSPASGGASGAPHGPAPVGRAHPRARRQGSPSRWPPVGRIPGWESLADLLRRWALPRGSRPSAPAQTRLRPSRARPVSRCDRNTHSPDPTGETRCPAANAS